MDWNEGIVTKDKRAALQRALTACVMLTVLVFAAAYSIYGLVMPEVKADFGVTVAQSGLIAQFQYLGEFAALLLAGFLIDRANKACVIAGVLLAFSAALFGMGRCASFAGVLGLFACMGVCSSLLNLAASSYVAQAHPENRAAALNVMHGLFSAGCILGPFLPAALAGGGRWSNTYRLLAGFNLGYAALFLTVVLACFAAGVFRGPASSLPAQAPPERGGYPRLLRDKQVLMFCLLLFLCNGQQICYSTWMPTLLGERNAPQALVGLTLSLYNIGIAAGRICFPALSKRLGERRVIVWGGLASAAAFSVGALGGDPRLMVLTAPLAGALGAAAMPAILGYACDLRSDRLGGITTLCCMACSLGAVLTPWAAGQIGERCGLSVAMGLIPASLAIISAVMARYFAAGRRDNG